MMGKIVPVKLFCDKSNMFKFVRSQISSGIAFPNVFFDILRIPSDKSLQIMPDNVPLILFLVNLIAS